MAWESDVLVIGGGAAAVRAAIAAADAGAGVIMVDKGRFEHSGTSPLGLHGYASVYHPQDSADILRRDIIETGSAINDLDLVTTAAQASFGEAESLQTMGVRFVRLPDGRLEFYQGSGHSAPHGINFDEKGHGTSIVAVLGQVARERGVRIIEEVMIADLLVDGDTICGAIGIDGRNKIYHFSAKATVLAAGGANRLYPNVTQRIAHEMYRTTGDSYALALRAGLSLVDMEFANFRDTPPLGRLGGILVNSRGEAVMEKYAPNKGGSAPRGKIVEAIYLEMRAGNEPLSIEIDAESERRAEFLPAEYKAYVRAYKEGLRPQVTITFQRLLGGARVKPDASTDLRGLYAAGESAGGFHGADRIQAGAFLETQVFGWIAGSNAAEYAHGHAMKTVSHARVAETQAGILHLLENDGPAAREILTKVQEVAWYSVGIVRNEQELQAGLAEIIQLREKMNGAKGRNCLEVLEASNLALSAEGVIRAALARRETRGTHRRSDFPEQSADYDARHVQIGLGDDGCFQVELVPSRKDIQK